ncbi:hypothetical protein HDV62DRAFT_154898 [Trichoderma sp. SZMC 28011]
MKTTSFLLAASMAGAVVAQKLSDYFPECSLNCLEQGTTSATDCTLGDAVCFCVQSNYEAIYNAELSCVLKDCGASVSVDKVLPAAIQFCSAATASASATAAAPAESTSATSAATTETTSQTAPSSSSSSSSSEASETSTPQTTSSAARSTSAPQTTATRSTPVGSGRPVTTASVTTSFGTAAAGAAGPMVTAAMLIAGAVAML